MKGDFSRRTFYPRKHYRGVRMQQGRVQLDADWNEQSDIQTYRVETEAQDVIGKCGGPLYTAGFHVVVDVVQLSDREKAVPGNDLQPKPVPQKGNFLISAGHYYVDGILCENEQIAPYSAIVASDGSVQVPGQPHLPGAAPVDKVQLYLAYLDVWQRHVTTLDDPSIREAALGGPDTATRAQTVWQVRLWPGPGDPKLPAQANNCPTAFQNFKAPVRDGTLAARAKAADNTTDPCIVPTTAGYRGLENQLYRVEVHFPGEAYDLKDDPSNAVKITELTAGNKVKVDGGSWKPGDFVEVFNVRPDSDPMDSFVALVLAVDTTGKILTLNGLPREFVVADKRQLRPAKTTFKWSRDNGSVVTAIQDIKGKEVTVQDLGPDTDLGFQMGDWVEITDDNSELNALPGQMVQIHEINQAQRTVTVLSATDPIVDKTRHPKLRRWHGLGAIKRNPSAGVDKDWQQLEAGVQVQFSGGTFVAGDYWQIPARAASSEATSGSIEWPPDPATGAPAAQSPAGIDHHYCPLGLLNFDGSKLTATADCRSLFPPVTEMTSLLYVSGDGQEAMPGQAVPLPLRVRVANGQVPVIGAKVTFTIRAGGGTLSPAQSATAGSDGIAECKTWTLGPAGSGPQQVEARLLDGAGKPMDGQVVYFDANLSVADNVGYSPHTGGLGPTVQAALDDLYTRGSGGGCAIVVKPGQSLQDAIDKALVDLRKNKEELSLCLCLTSGKHALDGGLVVASKPEDLFPIHLEITGCGRGTRLLPGKPIVFTGLGSVTLRDLEIQANPTSPTPVVFDQCSEVTMMGCHLEGRTVNLDPLCRIRVADRITVVNSLLTAYRTDKLSNPFRLDKPATIFHPVPEVENLFSVERREEFLLGAVKTAQQAAQTDRSGRDRLRDAVKARNNDQLSPDEQESYASFQTLVDRPSVSNTESESYARQVVLGLAAIRDAAVHASPGTALVIEDGDAETRLEDNEIWGVVSLYGVPGDGQLGVLSQGDLTKLRTPAGTPPSAARALFVSLMGTLHIRNNRLTRLALGADLVTRIKKFASDTAAVNLAFPRVYRTAFLTDNTFETPDNDLVARHVVLTSDEFATVAGTAGVVIADSAIYTANYALNNLFLFSSARVQLAAPNLNITIN